MRLTRRQLLGAPAAVLAAFDVEAAAAENDGFRVLTAGKAELPLMLGAPPTEVFGFAAAVPGPLLHYQKNEEIKLSLANALAEPITFACQGLRIANAMDGMAGLTQAAVAPGQSFRYRFTPPDAGFYWYRSAVPPLAEALSHGLYGPLIIAEPTPPAADRDLVVLLADWHLDAKAQIDGTPAGLSAKSGPHVVTVNSQPIPVAAELAPGSRMRLRLLSLIQSQLVFITFAGMKPIVIAIDGQPCDAFEPLRRTLPLGPGATFDVLCDLPLEKDVGASLVWRTGERSDLALLTFMTRGTPRPPLPPIISLPANPLLPTRLKLQAAHRANLSLEFTAGTTKAVTLPPADRPVLTLNGAPALNFVQEPLFSVKRGTPVTLGIANKTPLLVQVYVHGQALRLLNDLDDGWEPYWRSRIIVPEGRVKHVAFLADNPGRWAIECQALAPRPSVLLTWFDVL